MNLLRTRASTRGLAHGHAREGQKSKTNTRGRSETSRKGSHGKTAILGPQMDVHVPNGSPPLTLLLFQVIIFPDREQENRIVSIQVRFSSWNLSVKKACCFQLRVVCFTVTQAAQKLGFATSPPNHGVCHFSAEPWYAIASSFRRCQCVQRNCGPSLHDHKRRG